MSRAKTKALQETQASNANSAEQQCSQLVVPCETIREIAYHKWQAAGCPCGDGVEFWLEAETELSNNAQPTKKAGMARAENIPATSNSWR